MIDSKIKEFANGHGYDTVRQGKDWNGIKVYIPDYNSPQFVGLPYVILVENGKIRMSTADEAIAYLNFSEPAAEENEEEE